jgi:hypothetical protein
VTLVYKPDWEQAQQNMRAWWAGEDFGRCALAVTAPRVEAPDEPPPTPPTNIEDRWLDIDYHLARCVWIMRRTFYGGEAIPNWNSGYAGWNAHPTYLGCPVSLDQTTGWWDPILSGEHLTDHDYREMVVDPDNRYWRHAREMLGAAVDWARGKCVVGIGAIGGCGDTLAALRDTMRLLIDVSDCREYVRDFDLYLMRQWAEIYDELYAITHEVTEGSTCWNDIWAPGKYYVAHCDFSYMISPAMFRQLFLPAIEWQTEFLDYCIYHVDGLGSYAHVPALCELPRLRALQIVPGAGKPGPLHYMDMLREIQAAGKGLELHIAPDEVQTALDHLEARHLFIRTHCETEEEAGELLLQAERWASAR